GRTPSGLSTRTPSSFRRRHEPDVTIRDSTRIAACLGGFTALITPRVGLAQESVRVSGYTSAHFETSNRQRFGSSIPATRFRWELAPTLFIRGVPVSLNAMYATKDNIAGRTIDGFSVSLNLGTDELKHIIKQRIDQKVSSLASQAAGATGA